MTKSEKDLLQSKTFWGLLVAGIAALLAHFGITVDQSALVNECVTGVGLAFAVYGRMVANVPVTSIFGLVTKASADKAVANERGRLPSHAPTVSGTVSQSPNAPAEGQS